MIVGVAMAMACIAACGNDQQHVDPLTERLADRCGIDAGDIHYAGQTAGYGTSEIHEWWANDASSDHAELTLFRKMMPPSGWRLSCDGNSSIPITVSDAELKAAESSFP